MGMQGMGNMSKNTMISAAASHICYPPHMQQHSCTWHAAALCTLQHHSLQLLPSDQWLTLMSNISCQSAHPPAPGRHSAARHIAP